MRLKVLSWNIHKGIGGVDRRYRLERISNLLNTAAPDIALLQEVADGWPAAGRDLQGERLRDATHLKHLAFAPEHRFREGGYGNAVLSRLPIIDQRRIDLKIGWRKQRSALQAVVNVPDGREGVRQIVATSLHLGLAEGERRKQVKRLLEDPGNASEKLPLILGGDFNDVFGTLAKQFPTSFQRAGRRELSFPAMAPIFCLDGIYVRGLTVISGSIFQCPGCRIASDHLPIVAELELT